MVGSPCREIWQACIVFGLLSYLRCPWQGYLMVCKCPSSLAWCSLMIFPHFDITVKGADWCCIPKMSGLILSQSQASATEAEQIILANGHIKSTAFNCWGAMGNSKWWLSVCPESPAAFSVTWLVMVEVTLQGSNSVLCKGKWTFLIIFLRYPKDSDYLFLFTTYLFLFRKHMLCF